MPGSPFVRVSWVISFVTVDHFGHVSHANDGVIATTDDLVTNLVQRHKLGPAANQSLHVTFVEVTGRQTDVPQFERRDHLVHAHLHRLELRPVDVDLDLPPDFSPKPHAGHAVETLQPGNDCSFGQSRQLDRGKFAAEPQVDDGGVVNVVPADVGGIDVIRQIGPHLVNRLPHIGNGRVQVGPPAELHANRAAAFQRMAGEPGRNR